MAILLNLVNVITRAHAAYAFLCDITIIVNISYREHQLQRINIVTARLHTYFMTI